MLDVGILSTKIRTIAREEVTVPNAVVISRETVNFTRYADEGVAINTTVTIGYDTPWRQVEALLVEAAARTVETPNANRLKEVVRKITSSVVLDGQLDSCELTFADLERIQGEKKSASADLVAEARKYIKELVPKA